jgi:outer membrane protein TolC
MKLIALLLFFTATAPAAAQDGPAAAARPLKLGEAYRLAQAKSEALAIKDNYAAQLDAAEKQFAAAFRPYLDLNASVSKQQNADTASKGYLSAGYNLFSGMRDYIGAKAAGARTAAARLDLERARQSLYYSVAQAYFGLQAAQRELVIRTEQLDVTARRIAELQARADIGRSRRSEVVAAKTQLAQDKASYLDAASSERRAQQVIMFLTGLEADCAPVELPGPAGGDLETYLNAALLRPDLAAARRTAEAYGYLSDIQARNTLPAVDLAANYYVLRQSAPKPANRWDAGVFLNMPLYTGGSSKAARDAALAAERSAAFARTLAERQAQSEVRSAYEEFRYSGLQSSSLEEALALAAQNAALQAEDYKLGLVTNLDVLSALNTVLQTRLALSQARAAAALALIKLDTAAGLEAKQ